MRQALTLLRDGGVTIKLRKCSFTEEKIEHLGQVTGPGGLEIADITTPVIKELKVAGNKMNLWLNCELSNVLCHFVL